MHWTGLDIKPKLKQILPHQPNCSSKLWTTLFLKPNIEVALATSRSQFLTLIKKQENQNTMARLEPQGEEGVR
jgi:hypothetical protein